MYEISFDSNDNSFLILIEMIENKKRIVTPFGQAHHRRVM